MAKHEARRNTRVYHTIVAILILFCGAGLLGVGIWLRFSDNKDFFNLNYPGDDNTLRVVLQSDVIAMITGGFLILSGIISLIALSKNCLGVTFKIIYIILASIIFLVLICVTSISIIFLTRRNDSNVKDFVSDAWQNSIQEDYKVVCAIESSFECRGFNDNDCTGCTKGIEPTCNSLRCAPCGDENANTSVGCYDKITSSLRNVFLPGSIVSGILSIIVLIDIFFVCCL